MTTDANDAKIPSPKKSYQAPVLRVYGDIKKLTGSHTGTNYDGAMTGKTFESA
jgi:hypothetical protein